MNNSRPNKSNYTRMQNEETYNPQYEKRISTSSSASYISEESTGRGLSNKSMLATHEELSEISNASDEVTKYKHILRLLTIAYGLFGYMGICFSSFRSLSHFNVGPHLSWYGIGTAMFMLGSCIDNVYIIIICIGISVFSCIQNIFLLVTTFLHMLQACTSFEGIVSEISPTDLGMETPSQNDCPEDKQSFYLLVVIICLFTGLGIYILIYFLFLHRATNNLVKISKQYFKKLRTVLGEAEYWNIMTKDFFVEKMFRSVNNYLGRMLNEKRQKGYAGYDQQIGISDNSHS